MVEPALVPDRLAAGEMIVGAAFPVAAKAVASLCVAGLFFWGVRSAEALAGAAWTFSAACIVAAGIAVVAVGYYWILRSRTGISATEIHQTWLWPKRVRLEDVAHIKFVYVPYLAWLIVPRLVVRARGKGLVVFQASDPHVLAAFARLSLGIAPESEPPTGK